MLSSVWERYVYVRLNVVDTIGGALAFVWGDVLCLVSPFCRQYFRDHLYREFLNATCDETFAYADNNERDNVRTACACSNVLCAAGE